MIGQQLYLAGVYSTALSGTVLPHYSVDLLLIHVLLILVCTTKTYPS